MIFNPAKYRGTFSAAFVCVAGLLLSGAADAQRVRAPRQSPDQFEITAGMSEAMRYISSDPTRSLVILQQLDRRYPHNDRINFQIGYTFQVMGQVDSAIVYYDLTLDLNTGSIEAGRALGTLYLTQNRRDDALIVFDRLLKANNYSVNAYKAVGAALRDLNRYEEALDIYSEGRNRSKHHFVLTMDIAELHLSARQYGDALTEYLRYVDERGGNYRFTRDRIMEMMHEIDDKERISLIEALDNRLASGTGNRYVTLDVLAATYLEQGMLEKSLDMAIRADSEKQSDGTVLLALADQVITTAAVRPKEERYRYLDLGVRALDVFAKNHSRSPGTDRAKYMLATIYVQFGSGEVPGAAATSADLKGWIDRAITEYAELSRSYPGSEYAELANLERGDLLLHRLKQPDKALEAYKVGAINSRRYGDVFASRVAEVYLGMGKYDDAEHYLVSLKSSGVDVLMETGAFYTGVMLAFQGKYEAARDTLSNLAQFNPASAYTNDAIDMAWVIEEALQYDSGSLNAYISARQSEMLGDTSAVLAKLGSIVAAPEYETLRPRALFWMGRTLYASGDLDGAIQRYNQFLKEYADDPRGPEVQRAIAAVYEFGYEQYEKALREYEVVLMMYPDYVFLDEVRKDVRRLRYIVDGEE